jgi:ABC-type multidrug transport system ATPase subunit
MVKPSPFLILDEVDAPLDDPNIRRFTEVIREFAKNTQFIVITHNKRTMEMADCLYGVTMEEPGVSKLVSVNFKKEERTPDPVLAKDGPVENSGAEENAKDNITAAVETGAVETKAT